MCVCVCDGGQRPSPSQALGYGLSELCMPSGSVCLCVDLTEKCTVCFWPCLFVFVLTVRLTHDMQRGGEGRGVASEVSGAHAGPLYNDTGECQEDGPSLSPTQTLGSVF